MIVCIGANCALKYMKSARRQGFADEHLVEQAVDSIAESIPDSVEVLSLLGPSVPIALPRYRQIQWPPTIEAADRPRVPHQILRYLNGEEYPHGLLAHLSQSPIKVWLDDPNSMPVTIGSRER